MSPDDNHVNPARPYEIITDEPYDPWNICVVDADLPGDDGIQHSTS
jgi:hypothetical protein